MSAASDRLSHTKVKNRQKWRQILRTRKTNPDWGSDPWLLDVYMTLQWEWNLPRRIVLAHKLLELTKVMWHSSRSARWRRSSPAGWWWRIVSHWRSLSMWHLHWRRWWWQSSSRRSILLPTWPWSEKHEQQHISLSNMVINQVLSFARVISIQAYTYT